MKAKSFLLSAILAVSSTLVQAEAVETSFKDTVINTTSNFVERTVNIIATPFLSDKDVECLARNIFYESGGEPIEGKVAVGLVTLNRVQDPRYPKNVCDVVKQRTTVKVPQQVTEIKTVKTGYLTPPKQVTETRTTWTQKVVCQFSWTCQRNIVIKPDDPRWVESREVAERLARGGYTEYHSKYENAQYFHAVYVNPKWKLKRIGRVGNHIFYEPLDK
jgi:spore germination cell wall hydrolase CwlJ-like protein